MPVSNEHLKNTCNTWDGTVSRMMDKTEAKKLEKEGKLQITTGLSAKDLLPADAFKSKRKAPAKKKRSKSQTYETRQMKAAN